MNLPPPNRGCSRGACDDCDLERATCPYADVEPIPARRRRVFISGPLNADCIGYIANLHCFMAADLALRRLGFAPYNPAADVLTGIVAGDLQYDDYFEPNMAWLEVAEAVYLLGHSPGADRECARARELGIPVFDNLNRLREWRDR